MKPTCVTAGTTSLSSSSDFPNIAYSKKVKPVTLPPGRARLEMKPCPTGSVTSTKTIGIERITCTASERIALPFATMMSGGRPASSVRSPRMRPISPAVQCQSMRRFLPSVQPVADQRTGLHVLPECRNRRNAVLEQCLRDGRAVAQEYPACGQNDRLPAGVIHRAKCARVALFAFDFDHSRLQAQLAGRLGG